MVVVEFCRGDGVRGIRPPAVRDENSPVWDFRGVDTDTVAIPNCYKQTVIDLCICTNGRVEVNSDKSNEHQEVQANGSWVGLVFFRCVVIWSDVMEASFSGNARSSDGQMAVERDGLMDLRVFLREL
jgi:hypothetical protein